MLKFEPENDGEVYKDKKIPIMPKILEKLAVFEERLDRQSTQIKYMMSFKDDFRELAMLMKQLMHKTEKPD